MAEHSGTLGWIRPQGGMTAFPSLVHEENARPFCQAAAEQGILLAPGDCFDVPSHFRLGFAATGDRFPQALDRLSEFVKETRQPTETLSMTGSVIPFLPPIPPKLSHLHASRINIHLPSRLWCHLWGE
jgi:hypothetical protein